MVASGGRLDRAAWRKPARLPQAFCATVTRAVAGAVVAPARPVPPKKVPTKTVKVRASRAENYS